MAQPGRQYKIIASIAGVGAAVVLVVSAVLATPALSTVNGVSYSYEQVNVFGPHWSNFTYRNVTFSFVVWCGPVNLSGACLCGNVTEQNGASYPFSFWEPGGPPPDRPLPWETWIAPDAHAGVQFEPDSGGQARLLVAQ
jgi:hypothetical protein